MKIDLDRFRTVFFEEAADHLVTIEEGLLALEQRPADSEVINGVFRAAHSIKGAGATFGFTEVAGFTHGMETLLDRMRGGEILATPDLIDLLLRATDGLSGLVAAAREGTPAPDVSGMSNALTAWAAGGLSVAGSRPGSSKPLELAPPDVAESFEVRFTPDRGFFRTGGDPLLLLRELSRLGNVESVVTDTSSLPALESLDPESCYLSWTVRLSTGRGIDAIRDVFLFVDDAVAIMPLQPADASVEPAPSETAKSIPETPAPEPMVHDGASDRPERRKSDASSIRVPVGKVDELIDLMGETVTAHSMVVQSVRSVATSDQGLQEALAALERSIRDLQERVMSIRMVAIDLVFARLPRVARELAAKLDKKVRIEVSGGDTELDKQVVEQLGDPLNHLVRNSIDHGLESPADRLAAGKSDMGTVRLSARHEGGNVVIDIADDGRGLNTDRIRRKAIERGLIGPEDALSEEQLHLLIFEPGFSTAETVSDVSGRGVGADVVKRNVAKLGGTVTVRSVAGRGSLFRIKLPLTLAILDGLAVRVASETYILPTLSVVETLPVPTGTVRTMPGGGEVIRLRDETMPLGRLDRLLGTGRFADGASPLAVVIEQQGRKLALLVDELVGQQQVVIKSLEANYGRIEGVSGATILGDGGVALILDPTGLTRLLRP